MKPEKPKKAKVPAKRTRISAKAKSPAVELPKPTKKISAEVVKKIIPAKKAAPRKRIAKLIPPVEPTPAPVAPARISARTKTFAATSPRATESKRKLSVPAILLEGDAPSKPI